MRQLTEFKEDQSKQELVFSEKLTSFERQLVHEIAEQLGGLTHESQGTKKNRFIVVRKMTTQSQEVTKSVAAKSQVATQSVQVEKPVDPAAELMLDHARYATMSKADRHKNISADFAPKFHAISEDFKKYS